MEKLWLVIGQLSATIFPDVDKLCFVIGPMLFCFLSSKRDNELLLRLVANLNMLLRDESVNVVKKAILTLTQLYKVTLQVRH